MSHSPQITGTLIQDFSRTHSPTPSPTKSRFSMSGPDNNAPVAPSPFSAPSASSAPAAMHTSTAGEFSGNAIMQAQTNDGALPFAIPDHLVKAPTSVGPIGIMAASEANALTSRLMTEWGITGTEQAEAFVALMWALIHNGTSPNASYHYTIVYGNAGKLLHMDKLPKVVGRDIRRWARAYAATAMRLLSENPLVAQKVAARRGVPMHLAYCCFDFVDTALISSANDRTEISQVRFDVIMSRGVFRDGATNSRVLDFNSPGGAPAGLVSPGSAMSARHMP